MQVCGLSGQPETQTPDDQPFGSASKIKKIFWNTQKIELPAERAALE